MYANCSELLKDIPLKPSAKYIPTLTYFSLFYYSFSIYLHNPEILIIRNR